LADGREAIGHEAETKLQKKTQQYQIHSTFARPEHAKAAVLNSLNSADAKRAYRHAIDEFVDWYGSDRAWRSTGSWSCGIALISNPVNSPRAQSTYVLAPCIAYEAVDCGLLSADLAAGILASKDDEAGHSPRNWLTAEQGHALWQAPDRQRVKGKRDRDWLALLLASGLRRH
jgi:hypothetical protein